MKPKDEVKQMIEQAKEKVEIDDWLFFINEKKVSKARKDGADYLLIQEFIWSEESCDNLRIEEGILCYNAIKLNSEHNYEACVIYDYTDNITYKRAFNGDLIEKTITHRMCTGSRDD